VNQKVEIEGRSRRRVCSLLAGSWLQVGSALAKAYIHGAYPVANFAEEGVPRQVPWDE